MIVCTISSCAGLGMNRSRCNTRRYVSLAGIPLGNAKCRRNQSATQDECAQAAIAVGPSAPAITAQIAITIVTATVLRSMLKHVATFGGWNQRPLVLGMPRLPTALTF